MRVAHFDCFSGISGDMVLGAVHRRRRAGRGHPRRARFARPADQARSREGAAVRVRRDEGHRRGRRPGRLPLPAGRRGDPREAAASPPKQRELATDASSASWPRPRPTVHGMPLETGPLPRGRGARQHRRHRRRRRRPRPARRRAVHQPLGADRQRHGEVRPRDHAGPAPGTAELLKGVPLAPSTIKAELTTPTGAAILTTVVTEWIETPAMTVERIGHGAGHAATSWNSRTCCGCSSGDAGDGREPGSERRHGLDAGDQPRRRAGRGDRLLLRAAVRGRGARRVHDADPDEEEPARRAAERDLRPSEGWRSWKRSCSARRRRSASAATRPSGASCSARRSRSDAVGAGAGQARLARGGSRCSRRSTRIAPASPASTACAAARRVPIRSESTTKPQTTRDTETRRRKR